MLNQGLVDEEVVEYRGGEAEQCNASGRNEDAVVTASPAANLIAKNMDVSFKSDVDLDFPTDVLHHIWIHPNQGTTRRPFVSSCLQ